MYIEDKMNLYNVEVHKNNNLAIIEQILECKEKDLTSAILFSLTGGRWHVCRKISETCLSFSFFENLWPLTILQTYNHMPTDPTAFNIQYRAAMNQNRNRYARHCYTKSKEQTSIGRYIGLLSLPACTHGMVTFVSR